MSESWRVRQHQSTAAFPFKAEENYKKSVSSAFSIGGVYLANKIKSFARFRKERGIVEQTSRGQVGKLEIEINLNAACQVNPRISQLVKIINLACTKLPA